MSNDPEIQVSVEDRDLSPGWHLKAVLVIIAVLGIAYVLAVNWVLK
jgi:cytochrome c-type biogenesis protein CcmH/NrfG